LAAPSLNGSDVGLVVRKADTGEVLYTRQSDRRRQPASNGKLFTAASALDTLGADRRFHTRVEASGNRVGALLHGDLYLLPARRRRPDDARERLRRFGRAGGFGWNP
jgi:D-alanyl-D-alanine carboxypeptidase/D-alanyl-D-alanine-endopeptidase (penicillin-binding protein 4)